MDSSEELQRLLYSTLKSDSAVMAIAANVYDHVPANEFGSKTAYVSFGTVDSHEDDADCISGQEVNIQIDCWSKAVGAVECKRLVDAVRKALHRKPLELTDNALVDVWVTLTRVFPDPEGVTHGVVSVTCTIEEPSV